MRRIAGPWVAAALGASFFAVAAAAAGAGAAALAPLDGGAASAPPVPWRFAGLPQQKLPRTDFELVTLDGQRVLRIRAAASYGNLVHALNAPAGPLRWRWRLDQPLAGADLRRKDADDAALKVCAMFDLALEQLPFWERQKMRLARSLSGEALPAATLCYVWDPSLPTGTVLPNAYTPRLRWMVLRGAGVPLAAWQHESRDLHADFMRVFGDDAAEPPPLSAIAVGADADNSGGRAQGFVADLVLAP